MRRNVTLGDRRAATRDWCPRSRAVPGDIDGNDRLSYSEFSKVIGRIPDFEVKFVVRIQ